MNKKFLFAAFLLLSLTCFKNSFAQTTFELPPNIQLVADDDYARYEPSIIEAAKWLEQTDLNTEQDKRQQVNAFVVKWLTGTPAVTIVLDKAQVDILDKNPQLMGVYMASYSRYVLENKAAADKFKATKAALLSVLKVYQKGIAIKKNKQLEKLSHLSDEGAVDDYIVNTMKVAKS